MLKKKISVCLLAIILAGCSAALTATILMYLDDALQILNQVNQYVGIIPPIAANYFVAVAGCVSLAATETASTDPPQVQYQKVVAQCAMLVKVDLPGVPQALVDLAATLAIKIEGIIAKFQTPVAQAKLASAKAPMKLSAKDRIHLMEIVTQANGLKDSIAKKVK